MELRTEETLLLHAQLHYRGRLDLPHAPAEVAERASTGPGPEAVVPRHVGQNEWILTGKGNETRRKCYGAGPSQTPYTPVEGNGKAPAPSTAAPDSLCFDALNSLRSETELGLALVGSGSVPLPPLVAV